MKIDINDKQAVGIDISQEHISMALLRAGDKGLELIKSASVPVPAGAIKDGNIADGKLLSKAVRNLRRHNMIWSNRAAVSLFVRPVVNQIMDMPKPAPTNIRQFVQNEVKNCVVLPGRNITLDFCGVGAAKRTGERKVFAVAAESEKVVRLVDVCDKAGFIVEAVEPAVVAYLRAIYEKKIKGKSKSTVLVAMLRAGTLTLCVLKNGEMDFVRNKELPQNSKDAGSIDVRLADEMSEVVRFYDIEDPENTGKWEMVVFIDSPTGAKEIENNLKLNPDISGQAKNLQVRTLQDACLDTAVTVPESSGDKPSPVAIGLAARLLAKEFGGIRINVLPQEITKKRETRRDVLVAANVIMGVLLIMLLAINLFALLLAKSAGHTVSKKKQVSAQQNENLLMQDKLLDEKLQLLTSRLEAIGKISESHTDVNWVELLDEIRKATPGSVRINTIVSSDGCRIQIGGLAVSNEAVNLFVGLLGKSKSITSAALLDTHKYNEQSQVVAYQISCKLNIRSAKSKNVS